MRWIALVVVVLVGCSSPEQPAEQPDPVQVKEVCDALFCVAGDDPISRNSFNATGMYRLNNDTVGENHVSVGGDVVAFTVWTGPDVFSDPLASYAYVFSRQEFVSLHPEPEEQWEARLPYAHDGRVVYELTALNASLPEPHRRIALFDSRDNSITTLDIDVPGSPSFRYTDGEWVLFSIDGQEDGVDGEYAYNIDEDRVVQIWRSWPDDINPSGLTERIVSDTVANGNAYTAIHYDRDDERICRIIEKNLTSLEEREMWTGDGCPTRMLSNDHVLTRGHDRGIWALDIDEPDEWRLIDRPKGVQHTVAWQWGAAGDWLVYYYPGDPKESGWGYEVPPAVRGYYAPTGEIVTLGQTNPDYGTVTGDQGTDGEKVVAHFFSFDGVNDISWVDLPDMDS